MNILFVQETVNVKPLNAILHKILTFIYFLAHQIGCRDHQGHPAALPTRRLPGQSDRPLGFLIILTVFMLLVSVAKKIAWIIVCGAGSCCSSEFS